MRILFVCHGNTCRSPAAEAVVRGLAADVGLGLQIDSAGISADRLGAPATPEMYQLAESAGYDLTGAFARKISTMDYDAFDLLIAMDKSVVAALKADQPISSRAQVIGFMDYTGGEGPSEISDPWHTHDYPAAFDLIQTAARAFIATLVADQPRQ